MWFLPKRNTRRNTLSCTLSPHGLGFGNDLVVAAKPDTDYTTGVGQVAITGRYDSKKDSFGIDAAYAIDNASTLHGTYGVTDEKIMSFGIETGFVALGRRNTVDLAYFPPSDIAVMKVGVRQSKTKLTGIFTFNKFCSSILKDGAQRYELDARLNALESVKLQYNVKTNAAKVKLSRKLDAKNRLEAEYIYANPELRYLSLALKHAYSKTHAFAITTNYGSRKYNFEWDCKTNNGPWTITTSFPFNARLVSANFNIPKFTLSQRPRFRILHYTNCLFFSASWRLGSPHTGDWRIKRRFEF